MCRLREALCLGPKAQSKKTGARKHLQHTALYSALGAVFVGSILPIQTAFASASGARGPASPNAWCGMLSDLDNATLYQPPIDPGRLERLALNDYIQFFYRGQDDRRMRVAWRQGRQLSIARSMGLSPRETDRSRFESDTPGGGGYYVYTRITTHHPRDTGTYGTGSVGASKKWVIMFKKDLGDRLDWWTSSTDLKGKLPFATPQGCPIQKHSSLTTLNNGHGGHNDPAVSNIRDYHTLSKQEQGFFMSIDFKTYLGRIFYNGKKSEAIAKLKKWNRELASYFDLEALLITPTDLDTQLSALPSKERLRYRRWYNGVTTYSVQASAARLRARAPAPLPTQSAAEPTDEHVPPLPSAGLANAAQEPPVTRGPKRQTVVQNDASDSSSHRSNNPEGLCIFHIDKTLTLKDNKPSLLEGAMSTPSQHC